MWEAIFIHCHSFSVFSRDVVWRLTKYGTSANGIFEKIVRVRGLALKSVLFIALEEFRCLFPVFKKKKCVLVGSIFRLSFTKSILLVRRVTRMKTFKLKNIYRSHWTRSRAYTNQYAWSDNWLILEWRLVANIETKYTNLWRSIQMYSNWCHNQFRKP